MPYEQLKLENQICFPLYAVSRLITRAYQPHLDTLGITYPQYLVLMLLWEQDGRTVKEIADKLILNTNTVTPLLKRLEKMGILTRTRSVLDERQVVIHLTGKGREMEEMAAGIPGKLVESIGAEGVSPQEITDLKRILAKLINRLTREQADPAISTVEEG